MAKSTTKLNAQDQIILSCVAVGIDHAAAGIHARELQSMAVRGLIERSGAAGRYALTDSGRATLASILERAEIGFIATSRT
jgi:hypothetical protein